MRRAAIVKAIRTPIGKYSGILSSVRPDDLAALVIRRLVEISELDPAQIDDVFFGASNQAGEDARNIARMAALLAGLPVEVPGCTINRLCASGLSAINFAARMIETGNSDIIIAGGVESMSRAPWVIPKAEEAFPRSRPEIFDTTIGWRFENSKMSERIQPYSMGETAELVASRFGITREEQDEFAYKSQMKTRAAVENGLFSDEIVPVEVRLGDRTVRADSDEQPRPDTSMDRLAELRPAFRKNGTVTAGNSASLNDGAAALLIVEVGRACELGLEILGLVGSSASAGVHPDYMGLGPVPATNKALKRASLSLADIDVIELNEAFAAQAIACIRELGLDESRVNPNGGAIALGHPIGCSGARIVCTLVHEMRRCKARCGLATMCVGVGQGVATVVEEPSTTPFTIEH